MPRPLRSIPELLDAPSEGNGPGSTVEEPAGGSALVPAYGVAGLSRDIVGSGNAALRLQIPQLRSP
eukprot:5268780-Alexandrium_andersonii.AAC.1